MSRIDLSTSDEAALYAGAELERHLTAWEDEGTILAPESLLEEIESFICLFADEFEPWPPARWKLLAQLNDLIDRLEREDGAATAASGTWRPAMLRPATREHLRRIMAMVREIPDPPPPPEPRRIPLESVETLVRQGVSTRQICQIHNWILPDGTPDVETFRKAEKGEIEVPTHKVLPPANDGSPTRRPHNGRLMYWADRVFAERGIEHAQLVDQVLQERDRKRNQAARQTGGKGCACGGDSLVQIDAPTDGATADQVDLPIGEPIAQKRGRGRPRKHPAAQLEATT